MATKWVAFPRNIHPTWRLRILKNLRFDDGNVNANATNQRFDWLNEEK